MKQCHMCSYCHGGPAILKKLHGNKILCQFGEEILLSSFNIQFLIFVFGTFFFQNIKCFIQLYTLKFTQHRQNKYNGIRFLEWCCHKIFYGPFCTPVKKHWSKVPNSLFIIIFNTATMYTITYIQYLKHTHSSEKLSKLFQYFKVCGKK